MRYFTILAALFFAVLLSTSAWCMDFDKAIKKVDQQGKYLFYLHPEIVEAQGKGASSPQYGAYLYDRIIDHFEDRGLIVIEEVRHENNANKVASEVTMQVRQLIAAGVPARSITVAGFSKGGYIALLVSSSLGNPDVSYAVLAGCGKGKNGYVFEQFLKKKRGARLKGRILSIFASSDLVAGSCRPAVDQSDGKGVAFGETRLMTNKGHGVFFQPRPEWINPVAVFAKGGR